MRFKNSISLAVLFLLCSYANACNVKLLDKVLSGKQNKILTLCNQTSKSTKSYLILIEQNEKLLAVKGIIKNGVKIEEKQFTLKRAPHGKLLQEMEILLKSDIKEHFVPTEENLKLLNSKEISVAIADKVASWELLLFKKDVIVKKYTWDIKTSFMLDSRKHLLKCVEALNEKFIYKEHLHLEEKNN